MPKSFIIILIGLFAAYSASGQNQVLFDSLSEVIESNISDKQKVDAYVELASMYPFLDSAHAVTYAHKAFELAEKVNYVEGEIDALFKIAWINMLLSHYAKAESLFERVVSEAEEANYPRGKVMGLNGLGRINATLGIYEKALDYYIKAIRIAEGLGDRELMNMGYQHIGNSYTHQQEYEKALEYHFKSLKIIEALGDNMAKANLYNNIGIIYDSQGIYQKALDYYERSLNLRKELGDNFGIAASYNNLGMLYKSQEDYKTALEYAFKSLEVFKEIGNKAYNSYPILTIGEIYLEQKEWKLAKTYFTTGLEISSETGIKPNIKLAAEGLATIEQELGNYKRAYEYHVLFKQMEDSLQNEEMTEKITRLEADYKFQKERDSIQIANNAEKTLLKKDIDKRKVTQAATFIGLGLLGVLLLVLFFFLKSKMQSNRLLALKSSELEARNDEVKQQAEKIALLNKKLEQSLDEATKGLLFKNNKLSEYAYYNSHKTRAPIARLLGLVQVIQMEEVEGELAFLLQKIKETSEELDTITREMNRILEEADFFDQ